MIAGEPLLALRNFHEMLTNIQRHRPEHQIRVLNLKNMADLGSGGKGNAVVKEGQKS